MGIRLESIIGENFIRKVHKVAYEVAIERDKLTLSIFDFLCEIAERVEGIESLSDETLLSFYNTAKGYCDILLRSSVSEENVRDNDSPVVTVLNMEGYPLSTIVSICNLSQTLPHFKVSRYVTESMDTYEALHTTKVKCIYDESDILDVMVPELGCMISGLRHYVSHRLIDVMSSFGSCFTNTGTPQEDRSNIEYTTESGVLKMISHLLRSSLTGTGNAVYFTRSKYDQVDMDLLTAVVNRFKGFTAVYAIEEALIHLIVRVEGLSEDTERKALKAACKFVGISFVDEFARARNLSEGTNLT